MEENIPGFEGYHVTREGLIYDLRKGKRKRTFFNRDGYEAVCLGREKRAIKQVHRLVGIAYVPNPQMLKELNHLDGVKKNNTVGNLQWCTRAENIRHALDTGLMVPKRGEECWGSKLTAGTVNEILEDMRKGIPTEEIAERFGITRSYLYRIRNGKAWAHLGKALLYTEESLRGSRHPCSKLRNEDVLEIRRRSAGGEKGINLSKAFGVSRASISMICARKIWTHI